MRKIYCVLIGILLLSWSINAQENRLGSTGVSSSEIYHKIEKLGFLGSALFIAAHPDDENTRLISWLDNDQLARTAYLSLTRGDGGQNLIGPELREELGVIRTQELLEARNIDGGEQFFTRANDFGYSKDPEETLKIWDEDKVLSDVVRIIRKFQPDVIVNRFDHRTAGTTHGHHTSSAILSVKAFDMVNDPNSYPDQLDKLNTWSPSRLFFNTSWWFYGSQEAFDAADKTNLYEIESGEYFNYNGYSNGELAALSRSRHQSQGFGSMGNRGTSTEYLEFLKGDRPTNKDDIFSGIDTSWGRIDSSGMLESQWQELLLNFDFKQPVNSVDQIIELQNSLQSLPDSYWKNVKLTEIKELILDLTGIYLSATVQQLSATAGEKVDFELEITNRSLERLDFLTFENSTFNIDGNLKGNLSRNESVQLKGQLTIPGDQLPTTPYYLEKEGTLGMYTVDQEYMIGLPENDAALTTTVELGINGQSFFYEVPVIYKTTDRVRGEVREPFQIVPDVSITIENPVYIFSDGQVKSLQVNLKAFKNINGDLHLKLPKDWKAVSNTTLTGLSLKKGQQTSYNFDIESPSNYSSEALEVNFRSQGVTYQQQVIEIDYNHIPNQNLLRKSKALLVNPGLVNHAKNVAYINGAGDEVAQAIEAIGTTVSRFNPEEVPAQLQSFDAVVVGIRAFNVAPTAMASLQSSLDEYVKSGGTLIMQYNTNRGISKDELGPLDISLSRKRVTNEQAPVALLKPDHKILQYPNKINAKDFEGWVQERGLYFPESWDPAFEPILGMNDPGETQTNGSLIVAAYGDGHIVYTGLSLFRELPAGVSGAYRLLANMLNLGNSLGFKNE